MHLDLQMYYSSLVTIHCSRQTPKSIVRAYTSLKMSSSSGSMNDVTRITPNSHPFHGAAWNPRQIHADINECNLQFLKEIWKILCLWEPLKTGPSWITSFSYLRENRLSAPSLWPAWNTLTHAHTQKNPNQISEPNKLFNQAILFVKHHNWGQDPKPQTLHFQAISNVTRMLTALQCKFQRQTKHRKTKTKLPSATQFEVRTLKPPQTSYHSRTAWSSRILVKKCLCKFSYLFLNVLLILQLGLEAGRPRFLVSS